MTKSEKPFNSIIGESFDQVIFVKDYVQFGLNYKILTALSRPIIMKNGKKFKFPEPGSRDALCDLIDSKVEAIKFEEEKYFELKTNMGHILIIPLDVASRTGAEALNFDDPDNPLNNIYW